MKKTNGYIVVSRTICKQPGISKPKWCPYCKCFHDAAYKH